MSSAAKAKVSLTLSADLVALVDRDAARLGDTRSGVVERWLRRAASGNVTMQIAEATTAYYDSLRGEDRAEDEAIARASSKAAKRLTYDEPAPPPRKRRR